MMKTINLDLGTANWFAMNRAQELGFVHSGHASWVSDAELPESPDAKILWKDVRPTSCDVVFELPNAVGMISRDRRNVSASFYSDSEKTVNSLFDYLVELMPRSERQSNLLDVTFWYHSQHGPRSYDRQLQAPSWEEIKTNYPESTRAKLTELQGAELQDVGGKLILWQGEPGTGKTFALRALAEEWAKWCRVHYVLDPEKFFMEGEYLLSVILGADELPSGGESTRPAWRLIVLEDAGEMLARDAKMQVGQGLARLLNLCDGLLGQGLRVLVLITTNEQIGSLHEAVSRPGRCLAQINFEKFDAKGAARWLEANGRTPATVKQASLADLYAIKDGASAQTARKAAGF